jgi:hypothetical protein
MEVVMRSIGILLGVAVGAVALAGQINAAYAENVLTTDGTLTVIESTAPLGVSLTYVSGGDGLTGVAGSYPSSATSATAMNNYDHTWLQFPPSILMQASTALSEVFAIPGVDHGPNPYENLEFIIWGSNASGTLLEEGTITALYRDGFDTANTEVGHSDDYTSLWKFTGSYSYFMITGGSHFGTGDRNFGEEGEIDALAGRTAVPEPGSLLLLGSGLAGLAAWRMRKSA